MSAEHPFVPEASFDGGDLDCGSGLLLLIRRHIDPLAPGALLEIRSTEISVEEDLPAWCRLTGNTLVSTVRAGRAFSFLVAKGEFRRERARLAGSSGVEAPRSMPRTQPVRPVVVPVSLPAPAAAPEVPLLAVAGVGSWPRPRWMLEALHARLEGRLGEAEFQETADDAVRLAVAEELSAGADVLTDGEQRRDNYASFVGARLDNCQLVPIADLLPYVDHPDEFRAELRALDVPAEKVRHPAVFGPIGRTLPLAVHELEFLKTLAVEPRGAPPPSRARVPHEPRPLKVALPGPYLLARTMWMECISDRAYETREALALDLVRVLREEIAHLLAAGASIVQLDEPVLSEVVFGRASSGRSFMCGALGARLEPERELAFAESLIQAAVAGFPASRLALHVCRGNWTPDERAALSGDYSPLVPLLSRVAVGTLFLELSTPRAGELRVLEPIPTDRRIGVGVVDQKSPRIEAVDEIVARATAAIELFGPERVLLTPDCGFATFADNPLASRPIATQKLAAIAEAARILRRRL